MATTTQLHDEDYELLQKGLDLIITRDEHLKEGFASMLPGGLMHLMKDRVEKEKHDIELRRESVILLKAKLVEMKRSEFEKFILGFANHPVNPVFSGGGGKTTFVQKAKAFIQSIFKQTKQ